MLASSEYMREQMKDLADKIEQAEQQLSHFGRGGGAYSGAAERSARKEDSQLRKVVKLSSKLSREHVQGLMSQLMKDVVFNHSTATSTLAGTSAMDTSQ